MPGKPMPEMSGAAPYGSSRTTGIGCRHVAGRSRTRRSCRWRGTRAPHVRRPPPALDAMTRKPSLCGVYSNGLVRGCPDRAPCVCSNRIGWPIATFRRPRVSGISLHPGLQLAESKLPWDSLRTLTARTLSGVSVCSMSERKKVLESNRPVPTVPSRLGLVVHPTRAVDGPLRELRGWAALHDVDLVQVPASSRQQRVAEQGEPEECDLLVAIGGDGTALAAIRAGAMAARPVLAVACGSLGVLTSVPAGGLVDAVERFGRGEWVPRSLPALEVARESGAPVFALNDLAVVRAGQGQVRLAIQLDGDVFARIAGDGCIVSTPIGSSAYALAAGGPLLASDMEAVLVTPLPTHGGSCPSLVVGPGSVIRLDITAGQGGARLEVDGQITDTVAGALTVSFRQAVAVVVTFSDEEPFLAVLRARQIITDSPRIIAEGARRDET